MSEQRRAQHVVAGRSRDAADCRMLLEMLGLLEVASPATHGPTCQQCQRPMVPTAFEGTVPNGCIRHYRVGLCRMCHRRRAGSSKPQLVAR